VSLLGKIFTNLGARVNYINLRAPIPEDTQVLVLIHPIRPLTTVQTARVWQFLSNGGNVLLAFDPERENVGYANMKSPGGSQRADQTARGRLWDHNP